MKHFSNKSSKRQYYRKEFLKYSTSNLSDALDSLEISGGLVGVKARSSELNCAGFAFTIKFELMDKENFHAADNYIEAVSPGDVIVIDNAGRDFCTVWGNILTEVAVKKRIAGTIIYGAARDIADIRDLNYPLFSSHIFMQSGKARVQKIAQQCSVNVNGTIINYGDFVRADADGCVVIPADKLDEVLKRAHNINNTEQRIIHGVRLGQPLSVLREKYCYARPWEGVCGDEGV
jgi:regulator of RNase E activity RraA